MKKHFFKWIEYAFRPQSIVPLKDLVNNIFIAKELPVESSYKAMGIVTHGAIKLPLVLSSSHDIEVLDDFIPSGHTSPLKNNSVLFNPDDLSLISIFILDSKLECYPDAGIGVIEAKDANKAFFIAWYLSIQDVAEFLSAQDIDPIVALYSLGTPGNVRTDDTLRKNLYSMFEAETRIMSNAKDMIKRLDTMKEELIKEVGICNVAN